MARIPFGHPRRTHKPHADWIASGIATLLVLLLLLPGLLHPSADVAALPGFTPVPLRRSNAVRPVTAYMHGTLVPTPDPEATATALLPAQLSSALRSVPFPSRDWRVLVSRQPSSEPAATHSAQERTTPFPDQWTSTIPITRTPVRRLPPGTGSDVRGGPALTGAQVDAILAAYDSPATGTGATWEALSYQYGIDDAVAVAFFIHESTAGAHPSWSGRKPDGSTTHNIGNIVCAGYQRCYGRWRDYASWEEGIEDWYRLIAVEYIQAHNLTTVEQIVPRYAPAFENDVPGYIQAVRQNIARFRNEPIPVRSISPDPLAPTSTAPMVPTITGTPTAPATPPVPGAIQMPDLVGMPLAEARRLLETQGILIGVIDMQGRDHIPDLFEHVAPETVVSSVPHPGAWVLPAEPVVLGVRAPDSTASAEEGFTPPADATGPRPTADHSLSPPSHDNGDEMSIMTPTANALPDPEQPPPLWRGDR